MPSNSFTQRLRAIDAALQRDDADAARRLLCDLQTAALPMKPSQLRQLRQRVDLWQEHAQQLRRSTAVRLRESMRRRHTAAAYTQESHHTVC